MRTFTTVAAAAGLALAGLVGVGMSPAVASTVPNPTRPPVTAIGDSALSVPAHAVPASAPAPLSSPCTPTPATLGSAGIYYDPANGNVITCTLSQQVFADINTERAARDIAPLAWNGILQIEADYWANHMASTPGAVYEDDPNLLDDVVNDGWPYYGELGSNTGVGTSAGNMTFGFMNSEPHRDNMLSDEFQDAATALACGDNRGCFWVEIFGSTDGQSGAPALTSYAPNPVPQTSTPPLAVLPSAPTDLTATTGPGTVTLNWGPATTYSSDSPEGATDPVLGYYVVACGPPTQYGEGPCESLETLAGQVTAPTTSFTITGLAAGDYTYLVFAYSALGTDLAAVKADLAQGAPNGTSGNPVVSFTVPPTATDPTAPNVPSVLPWQLNPGQTVLDGQSMRNLQAGTSLELTDTGGLRIVDANNGTVWTGPAGAPGDYLTLTNEGNLVLASDTGSVLWQIAPNDPTDMLRMEATNQLALVSATGHVFWQSGMPSPRPRSIILGTYQLEYPGEQMVDGPDRLITQASDGNVVLYDNGRPVWNAGTEGHPGDHLILLGDGDLVVYAPNGTVLYQTGTVSPGDHLIVCGDGNLALVSQAGMIVWQRGSFNIG